MLCECCWATNRSIQYIPYTLEVLNSASFVLKVLVHVHKATTWNRMWPPLLLLAILPLTRARTRTHTHTHTHTQCASTLAHTHTFTHLLPSSCGQSQSLVVHLCSFFSNTTVTILSVVVAITIIVIASFCGVEREENQLRDLLVFQWKNYLFLNSSPPPPSYLSRSSLFPL